MQTLSFSIEQIASGATLALRRDVLYPGLAVRELLLPEDETGMHYGLFYDAKLAGVVSLFRNNGSGRSGWQFRKLAVLSALQGNGFGSALLQYVMAEVTRQGGTYLWCHARITATAFYEKHGFMREGEVFEKAGIGYVVMARSLSTEKLYL